MSLEETHRDGPREEKHRAERTETGQGPKDGRAASTSPMRQEAPFPGASRGNMASPTPWAQISGLHKGCWNHAVHGNLFMASGSQCCSVERHESWVRTADFPFDRRLFQGLRALILCPPLLACITQFYPSPVASV